MASNQIAIYNMAIGMVGGTRCTSTADSSVEVTVLNEIWPVAVDDTVAGRDWSFARKVTLLNPVPDPLTLLGQNRACFARPIDAAAMRDISDSPEFDPDNKCDWEIQEEIIIVSDVAAGAVLWARYTKALRDPAFFAGPFVACLVARLAAEIALPVTNSKPTFEALWNLYVKRLAATTTQDGMQGKVTKFSKGKLSRAHGR